MNRKGIKLNESQIRDIVKESITRILKEGWFDRISTFTPKDKEYDPNASIETVANQDGWEVNTFAPRTTDTHFELSQMTAMFGAAKKGVLSPEELINDIKLHLGNRGRILNVKVGRIGDSEYDIAKTLSFDIEYN